VNRYKKDGSLEPPGQTEEITYVPGLLRIKNGITEFFVKDALGSTALLVDDTGKIVQRYKYSPFGNIDYSKGSSDNTYQFTGKEIDPESGLIYFDGGRYYNALNGRWISRDIDRGAINIPQSLNRYIYCYNNPLTYIDVRGLKPLDVVTLTFFNTYFNKNFKDVDVQTGELAHFITSIAGAQAITFGNYIFVAKGEYNNQSVGGLGLIGHELTHVLQYRKQGKSEFLLKYFKEYQNARAKGKSHDEAYIG